VPRTQTFSGTGAEPAARQRKFTLKPGNKGTFDRISALPTETASKLDICPGGGYRPFSDTTLAPAESIAASELSRLMVLRYVSLVKGELANSVVLSAHPLQLLADRLAEATSGDDHHD
jgi:hypothetical protein